MNYEEDIRIDPNALDVEWLEQPELMRKYAKHAALMEKEKDEAKERLDIVKARIELDIRDNPTTYNIQKVTEGTIQSVLLLQEGYQEANREFNDAKYEYNVAVAAVRAFDQRKTALENLVRLLSASYFAGPQVPRDLYSEQSQKEAQRKKNTQVKIARRKGEGSN